jgi:hypothetical protein
LWNVPTTPRFKIDQKPSMGAIADFGDGLKDQAAAVWD